MERYNFLRQQLQKFDFKLFSLHFNFLIVVVVLGCIKRRTLTQACLSAFWFITEFFRGAFAAECSLGARKLYEIKECIDGKTVVITGCSTGIGRATAKHLYRAGARVIMACVDVSEAEETAEQIRKEVKISDPTRKVGHLIVKKLDLASLESIRSCADDLNESELRINVLINNAGVLPRTRQITKDGFELAFGTNYLGHFYLTSLLLPKIVASAPARIVNVTSFAFDSGHIHWADLTLKRDFKSLTAYSQSKLALVLFTRRLASQLEGTGVTAYSLHPGMTKGTNITKPLEENFIFACILKIFTVLIGPFVNTAEEAAATTLFCALDKSLERESGFYYRDCLRKEVPPHARSDEDAERLWVESLKLVNLDDFHIKKKQNITS